MHGMGGLVLWVVSLQTIPLGILISAAWDRSPRRRPRFWLRFAGFALCVTLPHVILISGSALGLVGEAAAGAMLWGGFLWGFGLVALAPLLLFRGPGPSCGPSHDGPDGPDPRQDPPSPVRPIGGVPLPDAEQSSMRTRGPHPRRSADQRRSAREPKRTPARLSPLLRWPRALTRPVK